VPTESKIIIYKKHAGKVMTNKDSSRSQQFSSMTRPTIAQMILIDLEIN
jgi:hypothetical protein